MRLRVRPTDLSTSVGSLVSGHLGRLPVSAISALIKVL
jgi:hypothetical protein